MKKTTFILAIAISLLSCQTKTENQKKEIQKDSVAIEKPVSKTESGCYLSVLQRDTAKFELTVTGDTFTGFLSYKPFETDSSLGIYEGKLHGDTLKGMFRFLAEGMISYEEVYFLRKNNKLIEGSGVIDYQNDSTVVFINPDSVAFGQSYTFEKIECTENFISQEVKDFYRDFRAVE